jgi:hypothetical protein
MSDQPNRIWDQELVGILVQAMIRSRVERIESGHAVAHFGVELARAFAGFSPEVYVAAILNAMHLLRISFDPEPFRHGAEVEQEALKEYERLAFTHLHCACDYDF